jgi:hypothetical protein
MSQQSWTPFLPPVLMVVGLGLLGLGWGWSALVPTTAYWGPTQAEELTAAQVDLHSKTDNHDHDPNHEREFAAARERFLKISQQLDDARSMRDLTGNCLVGAGILLILVGIGIHLAHKSAN